MLDQMVKEDRQLIQFSTVPEIVKLKREQVSAQSLKLYVVCTQLCNFTNICYTNYQSYICIIHHTLI